MILRYQLGQLLFSSYAIFIVAIAAIRWLAWGEDWTTPWFWMFASVSIAAAGAALFCRVRINQIKE